MNDMISKENMIWGTRDIANYYGVSRRKVLLLQEYSHRFDLKFGRETWGRGSASHYTWPEVVKMSKALDILSLGINPRFLSRYLNCDNYTAGRMMVVDNEAGDWK